MGHLIVAEQTHKQNVIKTEYTLDKWIQICNHWWDRLCISIKTQFLIYIKFIIGDLFLASFKVIKLFTWVATATRVIIVKILSFKGPQFKVTTVDKHEGELFTIVSLLNFPDLDIGTLDAFLKLNLLIIQVIELNPAFTNCSLSDHNGELGILRYINCNYIKACIHFLDLNHWSELLVVLLKLWIGRARIVASSELVDL